MLGTVRARAGIAFGNLLVYGTGGYAYGRVEQSGSITPIPTNNPTYLASRSEIAGGWTLGGGVEYAITPGISVRLDYMRYDLGRAQLTLREVTRQAPGEFATMRVRTSGDILKAGVNFGF